MALETKYRLDQFSRVFDLRNSGGQPNLLIDGQAVNLRRIRSTSSSNRIRAYSPVYLRW